MLKRLLWLFLIIFSNSLILAASTVRKSEVSQEVQKYIPQIDEFLKTGNRATIVPVLDEIYRKGIYDNFELIKGILNHYTKGVETQKLEKIQQLFSYVLTYNDLPTYYRIDEINKEPVERSGKDVIRKILDILLSYGLNLDFFKNAIMSSNENIKNKGVVLRIIQDKTESSLPSSTSSVTSSTTVPSSVFAKALTGTSSSSKDVLTPEYRSDLPSAPGGPVTSPSVPSAPGGPVTSPSIPFAPGGPVFSSSVPSAPGPVSLSSVPGGPGSLPSAPGGPKGPISTTVSDSGSKSSTTLPSSVFAKASPDTSSSSSLSSATVPATSTSSGSVSSEEKKGEIENFDIFNAAKGRDIIVTVGTYDKEKKEFNPISGIEPIKIPTSLSKTTLPFKRKNEKDLTSYKIEFTSPSEEEPIMWGYVFSNAKFQSTFDEEPDLDKAKPFVAIALMLNNEGRSIRRVFEKPATSSTSSPTAASPSSSSSSSAKETKERSFKIINNFENKKGQVIKVTKGKVKKDEDFAIFRPGSASFEGIAYGTSKSFPFGEINEKELTAYRIEAPTFDNNIMTQKIGYVLSNGTFFQAKEYTEGGEPDFTKVTPLSEGIIEFMPDSKSASVLNFIVR